ncbi:MAG: hypothetical protein M1835_001008 [Candelina submexicana]|nr:MAG: hypothetical protein M1835_001008 [Candelina submexicana]
MPSNFTPLLPSTPAFRSNLVRASAFNHNYLRDTFTLTTWLSIGAFLQVLLFLLPIRPTYTAAPVLVLLSWQVVDHLLMIVGIKEDIYQKRALKAKYTALYPDENGGFAKGEKKGTAPGGQRVALGPLAPGYAAIGNYAQEMMKEVDAKAEEYGLLSFNFYTNSGAHTTGSDLVTIYYFKDMEYVHKFANSEVHRNGWDWYNKHTKQYPHLGIMHELYQVPAGKWENVYLNQEPILFATAQHRITDEDGSKKWASGIVDAKGRLKASHVRLGLEEGEDTIGDNNAEGGSI